MFRIVGLTEVLPLDVRISISQVVPQGLVFYHMVLDIENVVDVSQKMEILTRAMFFLSLERSPFSLGDN